VVQRLDGCTACIIVRGMTMAAKQLSAMFLRAGRGHTVYARSPAAGHLPSGVGLSRMGHFNMFKS